MAATRRSSRWWQRPRWAFTRDCCCSPISRCRWCGKPSGFLRPKRPEYCAVTAQAGDACSKNIRAVKASLSFTGVYYVHPVIWILTEWLEPLCLTPPC
ncbi:conserved hypothetical protein [Mesorhizobium delmotii]|uniref:Uncharacterized protein n=1 Tax=Mesorhizobium delmotii TaxID=1631247 RepID=A0A2P9AQD4_9HYPH|nr:conserved hypothetical protein [Mesorhizobium delmotii]